MDKVLACVERIRVIRGVNYGVITNEQIQDLFTSLNLDDEQKKGVFLILDEKSIIPISEDEVPQKIRDAQNPPVVKVTYKEIDEQTKRRLCSERFEKILAAYRSDENDDPSLLVRYEEELPIFIEAVTTLDDKLYRTVNRKIVRACMVVSNYRVREARKYGWVCGTYMSRVKESFERWVRMVFLEDDLAKLLDSISKEEKLTQRQMDVIKVLLHNTPRTHVNRYISSFFDD